jgi:hypothetical protein
MKIIALIYLVVLIIGFLISLVKAVVEDDGMLGMFAFALVNGPMCYLLYWVITTN